MWLNMCVHIEIFTYIRTHKYSVGSDCVKCTVFTKYFSYLHIYWRTYVHIYITQSPTLPYAPTSTHWGRTVCNAQYSHKHFPYLHMYVFTYVHTYITQSRTLPSLNTTWYFFLVGISCSVCNASCCSAGTRHARIHLPSHSYRISPHMHQIRNNLYTNIRTHTSPR